MQKDTTPKEKTGYQYTELEEMKSSLKEQAAAAVWIQTVGLIAEAIIISRLLAISEESEGENKIVTGIWIQAIGQLLEAIGVTRQLTTEDQKLLLMAQRTTVNGDWLQSIGAAVEALGGERVIAVEMEENGVSLVP
ncbi:hypothetical protein DFO73_107208 [Cytobacillus oceanisediminis]|jgi:hypothetical protein|uniref:Uncharacterized protein n=1 Tax=Cytobacillus oceanisediminis TaxID=665099 RepID=A0A2V2ZU50_9BACI|nr:hypothetical protein [Cytobacillus oceanisediminis]PWW27895.1 hypothetical protein DFO73_107208 [Cytobacillus oceanisediminis]